MTSLPEEHWQTLLDKIQQGKCTPFIGAGACAGVLPLGSGLADQLRRSLKKYVPPTTELARVAQYLAVERRDNSVPKAAVADIIRAVAPPVEDDTEPHAALAQIGASLYLTTNYDTFMYDALRARGIPAAREGCRWTESLLQEEPSLFDRDYEPSPERPMVFHLHGGVGLHDNRSIVISEDDYLDYLVNISKDLARNPRVTGQPAMLPGRIRAALRMSTLLFVGYSLSDINFRVLLRGLVGSLEASERGLNLAVQLAPGDDKTPAEEVAQLKAYMANYFEWTLNIQIYWTDARQFAGQLRRRLAARVKA